MKISVRIAQHLRSRIKRRGLIADIEKYTKIERHTISGLLNNSVKYVSIDALAKISDYLIHVEGVDPSILPGALIGRDPENFWEMLACCERLDFCQGTRVSEEWPGADYVMSTDSRLQGVLLSRIAGFERDWETEDGNGQAPKAARRHRHLPAFHLVSAPGRKVSSDSPGEEWSEVRASAENLYAEVNHESRAVDAKAETKERQRQSSALIALGSVKVNPVVERMLADTFGCEPFVSQEDVAQPADRACPIMFRYRGNDPQPPSCCGGLELSAGGEAAEPGLYYETADRTWKCCPCEDTTSDAAFVFYTYRPNLGHVELACGGFSSRATHCLTEHLDEIVLKLGDPQFISERIQVGLYLVRFTFDPADQDYGPLKDNRPFEHQVIRVSAKALNRRLKRRY